MALALKTTVNLAQAVAATLAAVAEANVAEAVKETLIAANLAWRLADINTTL